MFRTNLESSNQSSSAKSLVTTIFKQFKAFLLLSTMLFASAGAKIATTPSDIQLFYNEAGFSVFKDGVSYEVEDHNVDQNLKGLAPEELGELFETQCIYVGQLNESEFALQVGSRRSQVFARAELGHIQVSLDEEGFHVIQNGESHKVQSYDVDKALRSMSTAQFQKFLEDHYVIVNQFDNGDFTLKAGMRCLGGGPFLGWCAYWAVKTVCYGVAAAAATTAVITTGGSAVFVGTSALAAGAGGLGGVAVSAVGGAIVAGGGGTAAVIATGTVVTGAGSVAAAAALVEGLATSAGLLFGLAPSF